LAATVEGPAFDSTLEGKSVPTMDAVVSRSADGRKIFIKAVNADPVKTLITKISLNGARVSPQGQIETLNGESLTSFNDFTHPNAVHVTKSKITAGSAFAVRLPQHSVSVVTLEMHP